MRDTSTYHTGSRQFLSFIKSEKQCHSQSIFYYCLNQKKPKLLKKWIKLGNTLQRSIFKLLHKLKIIFFISSIHGELKFYRSEKQNKSLPIAGLNFFLFSIFQKNLSASFTSKNKSLYQMFIKIMLQNGSMHSQVKMINYSQEFIQQDDLGIYIYLSS